MELSIQEQFKCEVCYDFYDSKDKIPKVLSCGHSVCQSCLENISSRGQHNNCSKIENRYNSFRRSNYVYQNNYITCPICRRDSQYNVDDVPINYSLKWLAEKTSKIWIDDICKEHDSLKNCECISCEEMMCGACAMLNHKHCETNYVKTPLKQKKEIFKVEIEEVEDKVQDTLLEIFRERKSLNATEGSLVSAIEEIRCTLEKKEQKLQYTRRKAREIAEKQQTIENSAKEVKKLKNLAQCAEYDKKFERFKQRLQCSLSCLQNLMHEREEAMFSKFSSSESDSD